MIWQKLALMRAEALENSPVDCLAQEPGGALAKYYGKHEMI